MNVRNTLFVLGLLLAVIITLPVAHADDWNQTTRFTFSEPVQIPGQVLPAGTYRFQLANTDNRHLVQIFREDRTLVATLHSIPRMRNGNAAECVQGCECSANEQSEFRVGQPKIDLQGLSDDGDERAIRRIQSIGEHQQQRDAVSI